MAAVFIGAMGYHHPEGRVTNADLEGLLDTTHAWIVERTGIEERRRVGPDETTADLAVHATRQALQAASWPATRLDLLVCATSSPDAMLPSVAAHIAHTLGTDAAAFDVNAACSGLVYGMATARSMMQGMGYRRVALCCADTYTRYVDYGDRRSAVLFGDGAATFLLQPERPARGAEVVDVCLENSHAGIDLVRVPLGGSWNLQGPQIKAPASEILVRCANRVLERNQLAVSDLKAFIAHQANLRILEGIAEALGVRDEQHWHNVREYGNQGAPGAATVLCQQVERRADALRDGDWILMAVVGSGVTAGAMLLRWTA